LSMKEPACAVREPSDGSRKLLRRILESEIPMFRHGGKLPHTPLAAS